MSAPTPARQSNRPHDGSPQAGGPAKPPVMPNTRVPLRFDEGVHRLVGAVGPSDPPDPGPIPNPHPYPPPQVGVATY